MDIFGGVGFRPKQKPCEAPPRPFRRGIADALALSVGPAVCGPGGKAQYILDFVRVGTGLRQSRVCP
jgi:hypothetical protein